MSKETDEAAQMGTDREIYFSQLRHQVRAIDRGVKTVNVQIDKLGKDFENYCDESEGMDFLKQTQTEIKTMRENIKSTQADLETKSKKVNSIQNLLPAVLANFKSRLESVESFMEDYGYKRPEFKVDDQFEDPNNTFVISSSLADQKLQSEAVKENVERQRINLNSEQDNGEQNTSNNENKYEIGNDSLRTPKLEGISESTKRWLDEVAENEGWRSKNTFISAGENSSNRNALQPPETNSLKNVLEGVVATPKLEGLTESTMQRLEKMTYNEKTEIKSDFDLPQTPKLRGLTENTMRLLHKMSFHEKAKTNYDFELHSTSKLDGLIGSNEQDLEKRIYNEKTVTAFDFDLPSAPKLDGEGVFHTPKLEGLSEKTMKFLDEIEAKNERTEPASYDLENYGLVSTPKLDLEGMSDYTLKLLNYKN